MKLLQKIVDIDSETNFKQGDVIITSHHIPCGKCEYCKNGNVSMCRHFKETNIRPGGFSELVFVSEEHLKNVAYLKPENLTDDEAAFYEPLGCCIRAVKRAGLRQKFYCYCNWAWFNRNTYGSSFKSIWYECYWL